MKAIVKNIVAHTYKPFLEKYLSKTRVYKYDDIRLEIPPQVFHPGFFFSTRLLLNYLGNFLLGGKSFFEPGCGSGLISIYAAKQGAQVTASDINAIAIDSLQKNSKANNVELEIIHSDLFTNIPEQSFDIIAINPPYYKKRPQTMADHAWYCGENGEYYQKLFTGLKKYIHKNSVVLMVLSEECDINMISEIASHHNFYMQKKMTKKSIWEYLYIYQIICGQ